MQVAAIEELTSLCNRASAKSQGFQRRRIRRPVILDWMSVRCEAVAGGIENDHSIDSWKKLKRRSDVKLDAHRRKKATARSQSWRI